MDMSLDSDLDSLIGLIDENDLSISEEIENHQETNPSPDGDIRLSDIFSTATEELPQDLKHAESSLIHTGDTSSDEEEKEHLTESGQQIKRKIAVSSSYETVMKRKNKTWKNSSISSSITRQSSFDSLTGIRIVNPLIPFDVIEKRMQGRKLIKMSFVHNHMKKGDIEGDWITMGVVAHKLPPKTSKVGKLYSIWKLTDLYDTEKQISLFLFGQVHNEHWKTAVGTVIGLLNPSIMAPKDKDGEMSITLDHPGKMMLIGSSKDFGHCKGIRKDGTKCGMVVNLSQCEYCIFHIKSEYKKFSKRSEIQTSYSGREPNLKDKVLKGHNFFYAGQSFVPLGKSAKKSNDNASKDKLTLSNLTLKRKAAIVFNEEKQKGIKKLAEMYGEEVSKAATKNSEFINNQLVIPSAGSKQFLQHMMQNKITKKEENICLISPKQLLKQHEQQIKSRPIHQSQKRDDSLILKSLMPQLGKGISPGQNVTFGFSSPKTNTSMTPEAYAKLKAIQKIKVNGPIEKKNPNSIKCKPEQKKVQAALDSSFEDDVQANKSAHEEQKTLLMGRLGYIDLNSEKVQKYLNQKSSHAYEVEMAEMEKEAAYFARLEKKELMEEKMSSTKEIVCDVVSCKQCRYTAHQAADRCKQGSHPLKCHKAIKRFFACKDCKQRTQCFTKLPLRSCGHCGSSSYERTGMMKVRSGPKLDSEILNICSDDAYFLSSL